MRLVEGRVPGGGRFLVPVAQWIEPTFPKRVMRVRFSPGTLLKELRLAPFLSTVSTFSGLPISTTSTSPDTLAPERLGGPTENEARRKPQEF